MKSLYTYIEEARQYAKFPMSYEQFEKLVLLHDDCNDDEAESLAKDAGIPEDMIWTLFGYIEGNYRPNHAEEDIQSMYNELQKIPLSRLPRILGAGSEGGVIAISNDKVIKWYHKYNMVSSPEDNFEIYQYFLEHPHKNFPKIYKVTKKYVVMERLEMDESKLRPYDLKFSVLKAIHDAVYYNKPLPKDVPAKVLNWHMECCKVMKEYGESHKMRDIYPGDLRLKNIGLRPKTKEVVWFDL